MRQGHYFFSFPDARVWGKHSAWQSTAIGGAHLAPSLRSRRDRIGQKPEPTFHFQIIFSYEKGAFYWQEHKKKPSTFGSRPKKNLPCLSA
jgi:hypothetical protein